MKRVGLITIGCRENRHNWADLIAALEPEVEVDFRGVLDGLTREEVEAQFAFEPGDNYLVTEMPWTASVQLSEKAVQTVAMQRTAELFADGADLLLADAGFLKKDWMAAKPHLSAQHCGELAASVRAGQLVLTHLNPNYAPEMLLAEAREAYPQAELATIGRRFYI